MANGLPTGSGISEAATGTITSGAASLLSFTIARSTVVVSNNSGAVAYLKLNDNAGAVSNTVYDFVLQDKERLVLDNVVKVASVGVFVAATSGVRAVGW